MKKKPDGSIVQLPTPLLRENSTDVVNISPSEIKKLLKLMHRSMEENNGVGLAAPQIGLNINVFVISKDVAKQYGIPTAYINPSIDSSSKKEEIMEEGCLSVPGLFGLVKRAQSVTVSANDPAGKRFTVAVNDLPARIMQHETDHLRGTLIVDKFIKTPRKAGQ